MYREAQGGRTPEAHVRALVAAGVLDPAHGRAALEWHSDLLATAGMAQRAEARGGRSPRCRSRGLPDIMAGAARSRVAKFEARAGGRDAVWFRAAWRVLWLLETPAAAAALGLGEAALVGALKVAAGDLAIVYAITAA